MMKTHITLDPEIINGNEDAFIARVDRVFPVITTNLEKGEFEVDVSADPDEYTVLMAVVEALGDLGLDPDADIFMDSINIPQ